MNLAIVSYKGGVGKTTVTANLASHLAALGVETHALDMDDQNGLRLHFAVNPENIKGISCCSSISDWQNIKISHASGVLLYPHGDTSFSNRQNFKNFLREHPYLLKTWSETHLSKNAVLLIDTPPGGDIFTQQSILAADILLVILNADGASFATIGMMKEQIEFLNANLLNEKRVFFLVSNYDERRELDQSVLVVMKDLLGEQLSPILIHSDAALREAMTKQELIKNYDVYSQANAEFSELAQWIIKHALRVRG